MAPHLLPLAMKLAILALAARTELQRWRGITINHPPRTLRGRGIQDQSTGRWCLRMHSLRVVKVLALCMHPHVLEKSVLFLFYKDTGPILRV